MEKTSKMITAAVVLVLCAVAVIGVGYAYTATTINNGNNATSEYIVLSQEGAGAYKFANNVTLVEWDTKNEMDWTAVPAAEKTTWTMSASLPTVTTDDTSKAYHLMQVGKDITITAEQTGGTVKSKLTCEVTTDIAYAAGIAVMLKIVNGSTTTWMQLTSEGLKTYEDNEWKGANTFEIAGGSSYTPTVVSVYYGYAGNTAPSTTSTPNNAINNATLTFTASTPTA